MLLLINKVSEVLIIVMVENEFKIKCLVESHYQQEIILKPLLKILLFLFTVIFLGSCVTDVGVPVGTVIESHEDCFVKTTNEFVRIDCPSGYVEPWFYESRYPRMTDKEKAASLVLFRKAQIAEEGVLALEESLDSIVKCSPEENRSSCRERRYSNQKFMETLEIILKQRDWVKEGVNKVVINYRNEKGYPKYVHRSRTLVEVMPTVYDEERIDSVFVDFLGSSNKKYSPELSYITGIVSIVLYVESDVELEGLLTDPRITLIEHVGDVGPHENIVERN